MNLSEYKQQVNIVHGLLKKGDRICDCTISAYDNNDIKRVSNLTVRSTAGQAIKIKTNEYLLGCPLCDNTHTEPTKVSPVYIKVANIIHDNKYTYNVDPSNPLTFKCSEHGDQNMYSLKSHLLPSRDSGFIHGCPICYEQIQIRGRYIKQAQKYNNCTNFYLLKFEHKRINKEVFYKVGVTFDTIENRFADWSMYNITVLVYKNVDVEVALDLEKTLKSFFIKEDICYIPPSAKERDHITLLGGASECFDLCDSRAPALQLYIETQLTKGNK